MKKFILKVTLFFVFAAVIDVLCGWGFDWLRSKAHGGQTYKNEYVSKFCKDDIIILGSSKADHHYVPRVFEESLGLNCYNAGEMGCGIIPGFIRYKQVVSRHKPKLVIYEVTPRYDYLDDNGYANYLGTIRQYTYTKVVRDVYLDFSDEFEKIRLMSGMYRNNSKLVDNLKDILFPAPSNKGYEPLFGTMVYNPSNIKNNNERKAVTVDSLKLAYVEKLIFDCRLNDIPLLFIISPTLYGGEVSEEYSIIFNLCSHHKVPILNNWNSPLITGIGEYFQDGLHLNNNGAVQYSKLVVHQIEHLND